MGDSWIKLICTIGPVSSDSRIVKKMEHLGVSLLRINMSHASISEMKQTINLIKKTTSIPICIDTEGAQIRTGRMRNDGVNLKKDSLVRLKAKDVVGDEKAFSFTPEKTFRFLLPGTLVYVDHNRVLLLVIKNIKGKEAIARVICPGLVESKKAVNLDKEVDLANLTKKDIEAIKVAKSLGINIFALSFTRNQDAVNQLRSLVGKSTIISKVETREAIINLDGIIRASDVILIDRGDLSRDVAIEEIPALQKMIISKAHKKPIPVYVATNLLESMVSLSAPTRAEINDIANTLLDGANGLVLAAETAIGKYPLQCVNMVKKLIDQHQREVESKVFFANTSEGVSMLDSVVTPHGAYRKEQISLQCKKPMQKLVIDQSTILNIHNIANGCYGSIFGFMTRPEIDSVLNDYQLLNGTIWTLPIVLQAKKKDFRATLGDRVSLVSSGGRVIGQLILGDIYRFDLDDIAFRWFGTKDKKHPGVFRLLKGGDCFLGGQVSLDPTTPPIFSEYFLSPSQVRATFSHYGWSSVVGFHTRNIPHRAHEYIQKEALEKSGAEALFIQPVLGEKKSGDFTPSAIMAGYKSLIENYYSHDKALLSGFFVDSWYSGPREAVFTALCRKSYGCSHFIVGRDHTGCGSFYKPHAAWRLFDQLGDLGIKPIFFDKISYDKKKKKYCEVSSTKKSKDLVDLSGTEVRRYLARGKLPPQWMLRKEVGEAILAIKAKGEKILVK